MAFVFSDCILDEATRELLREGRSRDLQPKVFDLLLLLAKGSGSVVERESLERSLWGEVRVGEDSLRRLVKEARRAVGDDGAQQRVILTSRGVGYRIGVPVELLDRLGPRTRPLVGFGELVDNLYNRVAERLEQGPGLFVIVGGAGSGKTRAAQEVQKRLAGKGGRSVTVRPGALKAPAAFSTLASLSRQLDSLLEGEPAAGVELGHLRGLSRELANPVADRPAADPEAIEVALELVDALKALSRLKPLMVIVEGVERIDLGSLAALDLLLDELRGCAVVLLGTCREAELAQRQDANRLMERLLARPEAERWSVPALTLDESCELVEAISGEGTVVGAEVHRLAAGNPLLVEELSREIATQGLPDATQSEEPLQHLARAIVGRRLALIDREARELLKTASVIGESIDEALLSQVAGLAAKRVADLLNQAVDAGLLERPAESPERPRFMGSLFYQSLQDRVTEEGRLAELHERIGLALVGEYGDGPAPELARHFLAAPEPMRSARGVPYAELAAARARDVGAWSEAAVHSRAAALVHRESGRMIEASQLFLETGQAELRSGGLETARASFRVAMECADGQNPDAFARAALGFADRPDATGDADRGVQRVLASATEQKPRDKGLTLMVASRLAAEQRYIDREGALARSRRVADEARRMGDPAVLGRVLDDLSFTEFAPDDPGAWLALNAEIVRAGLQAGSAEVELTGLKGRITEFLEMGDVPSVERELESLEALGDRLRSPYARCLVASVRATLAFLRGEFEEGRRAAAIASQEGARTQSPDVAVQVGAHAFYQALESGLLGSLEPAVLDFRKRFPGTAAWKAAHALLLTESGRGAEAEVLIGELVADDFAGVKRDRGWLLAVCVSAEVSAAVQREDLAATCARALAPYEDLCAIIGNATLFFGSVAHWLGPLASLLGQRDEAARLLDKGLLVHERIGAEPWIATSLVARAQFSLEDGRAEDARADHHRAAEIAERLGLARVQQRLDQQRNR